MVIALGNKPKQLTVRLDEDADFLATIRTTDGSDWPDGITVSLRFSTTPTPTVWDATITGDRIAWDVDKAAVAPVLAAGQVKVRLVYVDGSSDVVWAVGTVA